MTKRSSADPLSDPNRLPMSACLMVDAALKEDIGAGDVTTRTFVPSGAKVEAKVRARQPGVLCGVAVAAYAFRKLGATPKVLKKDGTRLQPGDAVMVVSGGPAVLTAERVALNFLQRLSGIATLTQTYVQRAGPVVFDTRKTTPLWRELEKYAVRCGGGRNHRVGLFDAALLKDNHWAALGKTGGRDQRFLEGVAAFRKDHPGLELEVEVEDERQLQLALEARVDAVLLDNMTPARLRDAIRRARAARKATVVEVSGGVTLDNIAKIAKLGPDRISIGRLTHSAPSLDLGLDMA